MEIALPMTIVKKAAQLSIASLKVKISGAITGKLTMTDTPTTLVLRNPEITVDATAASSASYLIATAKTGSFTGVTAKDTTLKSWTVRVVAKTGYDELYLDAPPGGTLILFK